MKKLLSIIFLNVVFSCLSAEEPFEKFYKETPEHKTAVYQRTKKKKVKMPFTSLYREFDFSLFQKMTYFEQTQNDISIKIGYDKNKCINDLCLALLEDKKRKKDRYIPLHICIHNTSYDSFVFDPQNIDGIFYSIYQLMRRSWLRPLEVYPYGISTSYYTVGTITYPVFFTYYSTRENPEAIKLIHEIIETYKDKIIDPITPILISPYQKFERYLFVPKNYFSKEFSLTLHNIRTSEDILFKKV